MTLLSFQAQMMLQSFPNELGHVLRTMTAFADRKVRRCALIIKEEDFFIVQKFLQHLGYDIPDQHTTTMFDHTKVWHFDLY